MLPPIRQCGVDPRSNVQERDDRGQIGIEGEPHGPVRKPTLPRSGPGGAWTAAAGWTCETATGRMVVRKAHFVGWKRIGFSPPAEMWRLNSSALPSCEATPRSAAAWRGGDRRRWLCRRVMLITIGGKQAGCSAHETADQSRGPAERLRTSAFARSPSARTISERLRDAPRPAWCRRSHLPARSSIRCGRLADHAHRGVRRPSPRTKLRHRIRSPQCSNGRGCTSPFEQRVTSVSKRRLMASATP